MYLTMTEAMWFLPFVLPICLYVAWSDMRAMRIPNHSVVALFVVFVVIGLIALPFDAYLWRYVHLIVALLVGMGMNALRLVGAGDAKFVAAAAPFIALQDLTFLSMIFAATLLIAWVTHRIAKNSPIRKLVPDWESWERKKDFPMGLALGATLIVYLVFGLLSGAPAT